MSRVEGASLGAVAPQRLVVSLIEDREKSESGRELESAGFRMYRGTSLIRNSTPPGSYSRPMPGIPGGGGCFL